MAVKHVALTNKQCSELSKIEKSSPGFKIQGPLGEFLDLWLVCEVLAKKLITYHKGLSDMPYTWSYPQLEASLKYFGIPYDTSKVKLAFHSNKKAPRGTKPARVLRNVYLHTLSSADRQEIESRSNELSALLNYWKKILAYGT